MTATVRDRSFLDRLIRDLEAAPAGNRELDLRIEYCLGARRDDPTDLTRLLRDEGFAWPTITAALEDRVPAFTTSIDAALAGENIVLVVRSERRGQWGAVHRTESGEEVMVWAPTEALARRLAGLKAAGLSEPVAQQASAPEPAPAIAAPAATTIERRAESAEDTEGADWKVMF